MTYGFKNTLTMLRSSGDGLIATALDGVVYTENSRLHIKGNKMHFIYKPDGAPVGWYARNIKTLDDIYLGTGACPTIDFENVQVENADLWAAIQQSDEGASATEVNNP